MHSLVNCTDIAVRLTSNNRNNCFIATSHIAKAAKWILRVVVVVVVVADYASVILLILLCTNNATETEFGRNVNLFSRPYWYILRLCSCGYWRRRQSFQTFVGCCLHCNAYTSLHIICLPTALAGKVKQSTSSVIFTLIFWTDWTYLWNLSFVWRIGLTWVRPLPGIDSQGQGLGLSANWRP